MGIQRAIVTNKKQKKERKKDLKTPPQNSVMTRCLTSGAATCFSLFSTFFLFVCLFFFKEHPRGLTLSPFGDSSPEAVDSLCDSEPAGFTDRKSLAQLISLDFNISCYDFNLSVRAEADS